jgi:proteasome lid subunit RPN8/RPN11
MELSSPKERRPVVYLKRQHLAEMIAHSREQAPLEACGILAGKQGRVVKLYRARNADRSPVSYRLEPEEQYRVFKDIEERALDIVGIYHSHPTSPPVPSAIDLEQAYYPEAIYFVVSLADPVKPKAKAFRIVDGETTEEEITLL